MPSRRMSDSCSSSRHLPTTADEGLKDTSDIDHETLRYPDECDSSILGDDDTWASDEPLRQATSRAFLDYVCTIPISAPSTSTTTHSRKRGSDHVRRPANCFLCFRSHWYEQARHLPGMQRVNNKNISSAAAGLWRILDDDRKRPFKRQADALKRVHERKHPDYVYAPNARTNRARTATKKRRTLSYSSDEIETSTSGSEAMITATGDGAASEGSHSENERDDAITAAWSVLELDDASDAAHLTEAPLLATPVLVPSSPGAEIPLSLPFISALTINQAFESPTPILDQYAIAGATDPIHDELVAYVSVDDIPYLDLGASSYDSLPCPDLIPDSYLSTLPPPSPTASNGSAASFSPLLSPPSSIFAPDFLPTHAETALSHYLPFIGEAGYGKEDLGYGFLADEWMLPCSSHKGS